MYCPPVTLSQKLIARHAKSPRSQVGLTPGDKVAVFYKQTSGSADTLGSILASHGEDLARKLGAVPSSDIPPWAVVLGKEETSIGQDSMACGLVVILARPCVRLLDGPVEAAFGKGSAEGVGLWVSSKDVSAVVMEAEGSGGVVRGVVDGKEVRLEMGKHFVVV